MKAPGRPPQRKLGLRRWQLQWEVVVAVAIARRGEACKQEDGNNDDNEDNSRAGHQKAESIALQQNSSAIEALGKDGPPWEPGLRERARENKGYAS